MTRRRVGGTVRLAAQLGLGLLAVRAHAADVIALSGTVLEGADATAPRTPVVGVPVAMSVRREAGTPLDSSATLAPDGSFLFRNAQVAGAAPTVVVAIVPGAHGWIGHSEPLQLPATPNGGARVLSGVVVPALRESEASSRERLEVRLRAAAVTASVREAGGVAGPAATLDLLDTVRRLAEVAEAGKVERGDDLVAAALAAAAEFVRSTGTTPGLAATGAARAAAVVAYRHPADFEKAGPAERDLFLTMLRRREDPAVELGTAKTTLSKLSTGALPPLLRRLPPDRARVTATLKDRGYLLPTGWSGEDRGPDTRPELSTFVFWAEVASYGLPGLDANALAERALQATLDKHGLERVRRDVR